MDLCPVGAQQGARPLLRPMECLFASAVLQGERPQSRENKFGNGKKKAESDGQSNSPNNIQRETETAVYFDWPNVTEIGTIPGNYVVTPRQLRHLLDSWNTATFLQLHTE